MSTLLERCQTIGILLAFVSFSIYAGEYLNAEQLNAHFPK